MAGGTPTLTLNDGGTATYISGSGTSALTFSYTVGAGQNTSALQRPPSILTPPPSPTAPATPPTFTLGLTQNGPQIDTTAPTIASLTESPSAVCLMQARRSP